MPFRPSKGIYIFCFFFVFHYFLFLVAESAADHIIIFAPQAQATLATVRWTMMDGSELLSTLNLPPPPVSVFAASKEAKVTSKQSQIGKTNILGGAAGLFGGFGPLMWNPVTFSTLSTGGASSEVTQGQIYVTGARGLFSRSRLLKGGQSHFVWNAATEPFTPPGGLMIGLHYIFNYRGW